MKIHRNYPMIGLMSGTSCDGLDIVAATFTPVESTAWSYEVQAAETVTFPASLRKSLKESHLHSALDLAVLDVAFGRWMGETVREFCLKHRLAPLAIASHGHTVYHQPDKKLTLQIGNGWSLHASAGLPVINDFRSLDVQLGGQGAPLVPIGDQLLFPDFDFCLNLGGIANISFEQAGKRIAFDVSPFNLLFNRFAEKLGVPFDNGGHLARKGSIHSSLLQQLNGLSYYHIQGSKSLGREDIEAEFLPLLEEFHLPVPDILATLSAHFAQQVAEIIHQRKDDKRKLLCTGGGAYNDFFIETLRRHAGDSVEIVVPDATVLEFKEALIFGLLGVLRLLHQPNCLASVTGAMRDNCGGTLYGFNEG
ncbi:MAG: anhydro-N-acetylmuramic acid kinase [Lunatimonas sp.]|uniref:anhydro-N-acetylmuramic acid kinase n=1 Tax=Lunatimonas sp. TaxID=2060141 RepID=UPI00263A7003|nr:anhydro-N-acetylmuramic acid kinase [Lunatimonas sp.]MCC5938423.1 anhydro-N-acetylmuramic acid kinase [Lunatimonas sp.]